MARSGTEREINLFELTPEWNTTGRAPGSNACYGCISAIRAEAASHLITHRPAMIIDTSSTWLGLRLASGMAYVTFAPAIEPVQEEQLRGLTRAIESKDELERIVTMLGRRWSRVVQVEQPSLLPRSAAS